MNTTSQIVGDNGWKHIASTVLHPVYRTGLLGLWDEVVSLVLRRPRVTVTAPLTFSIWVKPKNPEDEVSIQAFGSQIETGGPITWDQGDEPWG